MARLDVARGGRPSEDVQIMYGIAGERQLPEEDLTWLPGYEDSRPVRVGNAAAEQFQLDVYGEVLNSAYLAMEAGLGKPDGPLQPFIASLLGFVVDHWHDPDEGIWEIRGPRRQFTHSKLMAWVAVDRAVKAAEAGFLPGGPVKEWRRTRDAIYEDICRRGYDAQLGSFTQYYGSGTVDASLPLMPVFGFLPPDDPRLVGTVETIQRQLGPDGFVLRYTTTESVDGLPPGETRSSSARSGWSAPLSQSDGSTRQASRSIGCSTSETMSGYWPKSTTPYCSVRLATSRRPSRISVSSSQRFPSTAPAHKRVPERRAA